MAQGVKGLKAQTRKNAVHQERKAAQTTKKGARMIKPKKNGAVHRLKTRVALEKAINSNIEQETMVRSTANNKKQFKVLKQSGAELSATGKIMRATVKKLGKVKREDNGEFKKHGDDIKKAAEREDDMAELADKAAAGSDSDSEGEWVTEVGL